MSCMTILVTNQKGGVGKTTLADQLAFEFERRGYKVSFANLDNQGGTIHESSEVDASTDIQIVDTPGVLTDDFAQWCANADCVLIPTMPSMADRAALVRCYDLALGAIVRANKETPVAVVVNCYDKRGTIDRAFVEYLEQTERMNIWGFIPRSVAFKKAHAHGCSVHDIAKGEKAHQAIAELAEIIRGGEF